jgi:hypothetical protein
MAYESSVWVGCVAALCPSEDGDNDGTTTVKDFALVSNATLTNMDAATDWVTDDGKRALDFDGTNDHAITTSTPAAGAKQLGFAAKFRRLANTGNGFCAGISPGLTTGNYIFIIYHFSDGNLYCHIGGNNYGYAAVSLTNQDWRSVIVHFDGTQAANADRLKIWLDGTPLTLSFNGTIPAILITTNVVKQLVIGAAPASSPVYGVSRIDDVRVNLRIWSDDERAEIDASRGGTYALASGGGASFPLIGTGGLVY